MPGADGTRLHGYGSSPARVGEAPKSLFGPGLGGRSPWVPSSSASEVLARRALKGVGGAAGHQFRRLDVLTRSVALTITRRSWTWW